MKFLLRQTILFIISVSVTFAQNNENKKMIKYTPSFKFKDGIYLNFKQVKENNPIPKSQILTTTDYNDFDFFDKLLSEKYITIFDNLGVQKKIEVKKIWGYADKGVLYININNEFNRIPVFGSISHFIANKTYNEYDPYKYQYRPRYTYNYYYDDPYTSKTVLMQYILDFETGEIYEFNVNSTEKVLSKDPELYEEYSKLSRRKKKKLMFVYIRKYNQKHPVYFPVNDNKNY